MRWGLRTFSCSASTPREVEQAKAAGYTPRRYYESNDELREAIDLIDSGYFTNGDREVFRPLVESLLTRDDYMLLADYQAYVDCQQRVSDAYRDQTAWTRMSILNCARVGRFSSDRSIRDYCRDIWHVSPIDAGRKTRLMAAHGCGGDGERRRTGLVAAARRVGATGRRQLQRVFEPRHGDRAAAVR